MWQSNPRPCDREYSPLPHGTQLHSCCFWAIKEIESLLLCFLVLTIIFTVFLYERKLGEKWINTIFLTSDQISKPRISFRISSVGKDEVNFRSRSGRDINGQSERLSGMDNLLCSQQIAVNFRLKESGLGQNWFRARRAFRVATLFVENERKWKKIILDT